MDGGTMNGRDETTAWAVNAASLGQFLTDTEGAEAGGETVVSPDTRLDESAVYADLTHTGEWYAEIDPDGSPIHDQLLADIASRYADEHDAAVFHGDPGNGVRDPDGTDMQDVADHRELLGELLINGAVPGTTDDHALVTNLFYADPETRRAAWEDAFLGRLGGEADIALFDVPDRTVTYVEVKSADYLDAVDYAKQQIDGFARHLQPYEVDVHGEIAVFDEKVVLDDTGRRYPEQGRVDQYRYEPDTGPVQHEEAAYLRSVME